MVSQTTHEMVLRSRCAPMAVFAIDESEVLDIFAWSKVPEIAGWAIEARRHRSAASMMFSIDGVVEYGLN